MNQVIRRIQIILNTIQEHRVGAAAANAAFFIILSFIPCIILFFSLIQFTSIEKVDVLVLVQNIVPRNMLTFFTGIIGEAYQKTATTVSVSAVVTLWSAGKGMMALTQGLQWISEIKETRNYFAVRIRATLYTIVFLLSIVVFLLLGVFGNTLLNMMMVKLPMTAYVVTLIMDVRNVFLFLYAMVIFSLIYRFMPGNHMKIIYHMPGALLTSLGWMIFSYGFAMYIETFNGFANMYGSLTTVIILMLWLYFGMYITLLGAEFNQILAARRERT